MHKRTTTKAREWARFSSAFNKQYKKTHHQSRSHRSPQFYVQPSSGFCWIPPVVRRLFEVNSEPHTGARPSVRLCVGLITRLGPRSKGVAG